MEPRIAFPRTLAGGTQAWSRPPLPAVATGHAAIDAATGGGIARGRLHELFAGEPEDAGGATGFAAMLARLMGGQLVWLRAAAEARGGRLHGAGLAAIGLDPATMVLGVLPDALAVLRAGVDAARCAQAGVVLIELWRMPRALDHVAGRRLAVAAEKTGTTVLLLRIAAQPAPSVAQTRWSVAAAPSRALEANAPGQTTLDVALLRQRGRHETGQWRVEWNRDAGRFLDVGDGTALPGPPLPGRLGGSLAADGGRRAAG